MTPGNHITGVVSVNTALHRGLKECFTEVTLRDVAQRNLIIAREDEVVFNIMTRMARRGASIAVVIKGRGRPYASHVTGIISRITSPIPSPKVSDLTKYQTLHRITEPAMTRANRVFPSYEKLLGRCRAAWNKLIDQFWRIYPSACTTGPMGSDRREVLTVTIGSLVFDAN